MSERHYDSQRNREALDDWLTRDQREAYGFDQQEYDPPCPKCGALCSDHEQVQVTDSEGNDYETYQCPDDLKPATEEEILARLNQVLPYTIGGDHQTAKEGHDD